MALSRFQPPPFLVLSLLVVSAFGSAAKTGSTSPAAIPGSPGSPVKAGVADTAAFATATFSGGPFWGLEAALEAVPGVASVTTGYLGDPDTSLTYAKVVEGNGSQRLAVEVRYNPKTVRYGKLAEVFWRQINPSTQDKQFNDSGPQFHTALYYRDSVQRKEAENSLYRLQRGGRFKKPIAASVEPLKGVFHPAEEAQQDYHKRNAQRFRAWLSFSGRQKALDSIWGTGTGVKTLGRPNPHSSGSASQ